MEGLAPSCHGGDARARLPVDAQSGAGDGRPAPELADGGEKIVLESATQELMKEHGFERKRAATVAAHMLRRYSEW